MADEVGAGGWRAWIGLALLVVVFLLGGVFLELTASDLREEWYLQVYLVSGLLAVVGYVVCVHLPNRRTIRDYRDLQRSHHEQCRALGVALEEMQHGDLVAERGPSKRLPDEMRRAVDTASRALAALIQQIQSSSVDVAAAA
ncbi:MAG: hypothetical protein P8127_17360, partial [Acidobacteriota bacterium]